MTSREADALAELHAACFTTPRPWSAAEFQDLAASPHHILISHPGLSLAVAQVVLDEAELLTIAVDPAQRRAGAGRKLLDEIMAAAARRGATRMFLDVAADNDAAVALYSRAGFVTIGRRRGYYRHAGHAVDALLMERTLNPPQGQSDAA